MNEGVRASVRLCMQAGRRAEGAAGGDGGDRDRENGWLLRDAKSSGMAPTGSGYSESESKANERMNERVSEYGGKTGRQQEGMKRSL